MSDNIKVVVKVRPLITREIEEKLSYQWRVKNDSLYQLDETGKDVGQYFTFDKVYDKDAKTTDVYNDIAKPIVESAISGFNGTIFAYGQTSSGKTYTMSGTANSPGIIQLAVLNLFDIIKKVPNRDFLVRVSYIEIYNEQVKDLLDADKKIVKVGESYNGVKVESTEKMTSTAEEVFKIMKEGEANRQIGATNMNEESSRSHTIFQIIIESRDHVEGEQQPGCVNVSQLNLVDLAGSERAGQTGATGMRFKEGTIINKSLLSLSLVIKQLSEDPKKFVNYRDSKLTRILQNSLGGNAKTSIICAITPAAVDETISTLQFANRAKAIKNKPEVNAVSTENTKIQSLTKKLCRLQAQLESKKSLEKDNQNLNKQIATLQRLILNGFSRRSTEPSASNRRKTWCAPLPDAPAPPAPAPYCTPLLKYNPLTTAGAPELSIEHNPYRDSKLPSVPEEYVVGQLTPPQTKRVNFSDEIISIDSDDDDSVPEECSPYHKCRGKSKTPPCVLRKNAKQAERNLKDIVELTEREKIYKPSVVELLEKIEQNGTVIAKLKDQIDEFNNKCREKDLEINTMKIKISKTEDKFSEITSEKVKFETQCKEYLTRITDLEVSYETLQNRSKRREEELLSLLNDQKLEKKQNIDISDRPIKIDFEKEHNFMDLSKDISLVNSDNENSAIHTQVEDNYHQLHTITELQNQQVIKIKRISELENNLLEQKQKISNLETICKNFEDDATSLRHQLDHLENENTKLEYTIQTLNTTIKCQKDNLDTVNSDVESLNNLICELQTNMYNYDKHNDNSYDSLLNKMQLNSEKFIANKENMENLILSFKNSIESRNEEITKLKSVIETHSNSNVINIDEQLQFKEQEICYLTDEMKTLQKKINENIDIVNKLQLDNSNLLSVKQDFIEKLESYQKDNYELRNACDENNKQIISFAETIERLKIESTQEKEKQLELSSKNEYLLKQIDDLTQQNCSLLNDIQVKESLIISLTQNEKDTEDCITKAKLTVDKVQGILRILTGEIKAIPAVFDNYIFIFNVLYDTLHDIESVAANVISQKNAAEEFNTANIEKHKTEMANLQQIIDTYKNIENEQRAEIIELKNQKLHLGTELNKLVDELEMKNHDYIDLQTELNNAKENNENLRNDLLLKEGLIDSIKQEYNKREIRGNDILQNIVKQMSENFEKTLLKQHVAITELNRKLNNVVNLTNQKLTFIHNYKLESGKVIKNEEKLLENILQKVTTVTNKYKIENNISCDIDTYEKINVTLDKICHFVEYICNENLSEGDSSENQVIISDPKDEIRRLTEHNHNLIKNLSNVLTKNNQLLGIIEDKQSVSSSLSNHLIDSNKLLKLLHDEFKINCNELYEIEQQTKTLNKQFKSFGNLMDRQIQELNEENIALKYKCSQLEMKNNSETSLNSNSSDNLEKFTTKSLPSIVDNNSPKSLLTLCCNKIIDVIQPVEDTSPSETHSFSDPSLDNTKVCQCDMLSLELQKLQEENIKLQNNLYHQELTNQNFVKEHEEIRKEIQLLIEPAKELQKKIVNHRTNLYTLTATTYTENKLLNSKLKVLHHHHDRLHNVSQKDLSLIKNQLEDLFSLFKTDDLSMFKRYSLPDVLDKNCTVATIRNESTLDPELLMLDTNLTLTSENTTLVGHDQTSVDLNQVYLDQITSPSDENQVLLSGLSPHIDILTNDNRQMILQIQHLRDENIKLKDLLLNTDKAETSKSTSDGNKSFSKTLNKCKNCERNSTVIERLKKEISELSEKLVEVTSEKDDICKKYENLSLEIPATETLVKKINCLEKDNNAKLNEIEKMSNAIKNKTREMQQLQEENDTLSTQIFENITESDDLRKEVDELKKENQVLSKKCTQLQHSNTKSNQYQNEHLLLSSNIECYSKLERSHSDSDSSSRCNKISTLQNELHASQEDCKKLTEEVATIKSHLDLSMGMELDESMEEQKLFTDRVHSVDYTESHVLQSYESIPNVYSADKIECFNYYIEITGSNKDVLEDNIKIIDIMKLLYNNLVAKHANEVENFSNNLKDLDENKKLLQEQLKTTHEKYSKILNDIEIKSKKVKTISNSMMQFNQVLHTISSDKTNFDNTDAIMNFKELLYSFDKEFELPTAEVFQSLINNIATKQQENISQYTMLQEQMKIKTVELDSVNNSLSQLQTKMTEKENEFNLLQAQNKKIFDISSAVTMDIVKKEQELKRVLLEGCEKLIEHKLIDSFQRDASILLSENLTLLFENLIDHSKLQKNLNFEEEKKKLENEVQCLKTSLQEKLVEIKALKLYNDELKSSNIHKTNELDLQKTDYYKLNITHENMLRENAITVEKLTKEINMYKEKILEKESTIKDIENKLLNQDNVEMIRTKLDARIDELENEISKLKNINNTIIELNKSLETDLQKSKEIIKHNKADLDNMTVEILNLKETIKNNINLIEDLKQEVKLLSEQNSEIKTQFAETDRECNRLKTNIKTHEKTAEIQSSMIIRLKKQKETDVKTIEDGEKKIDELTQKYGLIKNECDCLTNKVKTLESELSSLQNVKDNLQLRVSELESELDRKARLSLESINNSRRRRQSIIDSNRIFSETKPDNENKVEAMFASRSSKPEDLFTMDVDDNSSNRSTPIRLSRGRDSSTQKDQSEEECPSRPSSVQAARRRRQSTHDTRRCTLQLAPHDVSHVIDERNKMKDTEDNDANLKEQLASCQQEVEELKQRLEEVKQRLEEVDEECEICSQYLQERDQQCISLRKEKSVLEKQVMELNEKLKQCENVSGVCTETKNVSVNTDEDWSNLHSVFVDRMSFDAEVEKNKRLVKGLEEFRMKNRELKAMLAKMQRALEQDKKLNVKDYEAMKLKLQTYKEEIEELRKRCQELDEECEICGEHLREKDELIRRLKEEKSTVLSKSQELSEESSGVANSVRKKRQSIHDQNREAVHNDTATEGVVSLSEGDSSRRDDDHQVHKLRQTIDKLLHQKTELEQQLRSLSSASQTTLYVATGSGIVQNQKMSDLIKENQKLKKVNSKLISVCKKRGKASEDRENEDPAELR